MRHVFGIGLAIVMVLAMFFAGAWGYLRLLRLPTPDAGLPAQGGSLLSYNGVLAALAAVAATGLAAGILVAVPRISPLAAGLPGLLLIAWTMLYLVSVHRAIGLIPMRSNAFGAGWESMLFNGVLGGVGLAMIVPLFLPSRWRRADAAAESEAAESEMSEARGFIADLRDSPEQEDGARPIPPAISGSRTARGARPEPLRAPGSSPDRYRRAQPF
jgi:hypothetical protein